MALDLSQLDGNNGFIIEHLSAWGDVGASGLGVSGAGDLNGDGISDLVIGAPGADSDGKIDAGESYVVFGSRSGFPATMEPSALDGSNGIIIKGIAAYDHAGISVRGAGDVNGDDIDDLIIGSYIFNPYVPLKGQAYVVFGNREGFPAAFGLSSLDGGNGFIINGIDGFDLLGVSTTGGGDVNADGIADLLVGAWAADPHGIDRAGESYVIFGSTAGFSATFNPATLDGANGFTLNGIDAVDRSGSPLDMAADFDFNADGIADLLVGAAWADPNDVVDAGEAYVVYGSPLAFSASLELSALDGINGFVLYGVKASDNSSWSLAGAGDINGDGISDVVSGAPFADPNGIDSAGEAYVIFGTSSGVGSDLDLASLDGTNGFQINGIAAGDQTGWAAMRAGDVDGDGYDDLLIGAPQTDAGDRLDAGAAYLLFGTDAGFVTPLELASLDAGRCLVFTGLVASEKLGGSVSAAGDLNGGGVDDFVIGALGPEPETGRAYVVFGESLERCDLPSQPSDVTARITGRSVLLRWSTSDDADRYAVYRRVNGEGSFEEIVSIVGRRYRDTDYNRASEFDLLEYYITAMNDCGESEPSRVVTLVPQE